MDGVATPIIGRPRPLPGHDTPNPAYHPHTLNYEEPVIGASPYAWRWLGRYAKHSDGSIERVPVEINGPLPPLSHDADAASRIEG